MFKRASKPPLTRDQLTQILDSRGSRKMKPEEVTGVFNLALERLQFAIDSASDDMFISTTRLIDETDATHDLAVKLSTPPPPAPPEKK